MQLQIGVALGDAAGVGGVVLGLRYSAGFDIILGEFCALLVRQVAPRKEAKSLALLKETVDLGGALVDELYSTHVTRSHRDVE